MEKILVTEEGPMYLGSRHGRWIETPRSETEAILDYLGENEEQAE